MSEQDTPKPTDPASVEGTYMDRSIVDFQRACAVQIAEEQRRIAPDTALIALLCDAVRCSRELAEKSTEIPSAALTLDRQQHQQALDALRAERDRLKALLATAQTEFCSMRCPSAWKTTDPPENRHVPECRAMQLALTPTQEPTPRRAWRSRYVGSRSI